MNDRLLIVTQKIDERDSNLGFFVNWVKEFSKYFSRVYVITSFVGEYSLPQNVMVYSLGKESRKNKTKRIIKYQEHFSSLYHKSSAVFFHMIPEFVIASAPYLLSLKKNTGLWYVHKSLTPKLRLAEKLVDFVFTASPLSFRLPSKKVIYTGHAIDTDLFYPYEKGKVINKGLKIISLGRISPIKDYETMISACSHLKNNFSYEWSFSIYGNPILERDKKYLNSLKNKIRGIGLEDRIHLFGARPFAEIPQVLNEHDMFINLSGTGSLDKSILEAMSAGLSVITSNESFKEILEEPYFLSKKNDLILSERIKALANEARPNLNLRNMVMENHSLSKTINNIVNTLKSQI